MPMTTSESALPVRRVTMAGCSSPGKGLPSSRTAPQPGSSEVLPSMSSRLRPSIRSAAGLRATMRPSAAWNTAPSAMAFTSDEYRDSLTASLASIWRCAEMSRAITETPCGSNWSPRRLSVSCRLVPLSGTMYSVLKFPSRLTRSNHSCQIGSASRAPGRPENDRPGVISMPWDCRQ